MSLIFTGSAETMLVTIAITAQMRTNKRSLLTDMDPPRKCRCVWASNNHNGPINIEATLLLFTIRTILQFPHLWYHRVSPLACNVIVFSLLWIQRVPRSYCARPLCGEGASLKPEWSRGIFIFTLVLICGWLLKLVTSQVSASPEAPTVWLGISFMATAIGVCTAVLGWYFFRQADQLTTLRINRAILEFRRKLSIEQAQCEEANRHLISGYMQWFDRHDLETAISHFEQAVRAFPHGLGGYVALGHAYYSRGETKKAFELLNQALSLYPDRKEPYRDIAGLFIREGDLVRALEYVEKAVQVDPSVRRDLLEDPLFDALKYEERTRYRYERALDH